MPLPMPQKYLLYFFIMANLIYTALVLGILLFLVEICILCWVKFYSVSHSAAWTATGLLIPIMVVFIAFAAHFYLKLVSHKSEVYEDNIKELELLQVSIL